MRRLILLLLCAAITLAGCKTGQGMSDNTSMERAAVNTLPMAVPDQTFALVRIDLASVDEGTKRLTALADQLGGQAPEIRDPARSLVAALLRDLTDFQRQFGRSMELPDEHLSGLDTSGAMYVALSTSGNEQLFRVLRNRVPESDATTVPRGFFVRIFLPSAKPDELTAWIENACEEQTYECDDYERVVSDEGGVIVDVRLGSLAGYLEEHGVDPSLPQPGDDADFFAERTVPAIQFLESEAALGLYLRSDRLVEVGALMGMAEVFEALEYATPNHRRAVYQRGMGLAGGMLRVGSPEAREVYDSATFLDFDDSGLHVDSVRGLTERGAKVAGAGQIDVELSTINVADPLLQLEYSYDLSAARGAAVTPEWMTEFDDENMHGLRGLFRDSGARLYVIAAHNYPAGFGRGMSTLAAAAGSEEALLMQQLEYLNGVHLSLTLERDDESPVGVSPRGGLVANFDTRADIERWVERFERGLGDEDDERPFGIRTAVEEREDGIEVRIMLGDVEVGERKSVSAMMSAVLDMSGLRALGDAVKGGPGRQLELLAPILEAGGEMSIESYRVPSASGFRMSVGGSETSPLGISDDIEPVAVSVGESDCLMDARRASGRQMDALGKVKGQARPAAMVAFVREFEREHRECEEAADEIAWMRSKWLKEAAIRYANGLEFGEAAAVFDEACELGEQSACELAERARDPKLPVEFATISEDLSSWVSRDTPMPAVGVDDVRYWRFQWPRGAANERVASLKGIDWSDDGERQRVARMVGDGTSTGFPVMVDQAAEAMVLALMSVQAGESMETGVMRYRRSRTDPIGVLVPVKVAGRDRLGQLEFMAPGSQPPHIVVDMSTGGIDIRLTGSQGEIALEPVRGCSDDGPTVCPAEDLDEIWEALRTASPDERADVVARYREAMRLDTAFAQFDKIDFDALRSVQSVRIGFVVGPNVPFLVLAEMAAAAKLYGGDDMTLEVAPR